MTIFLLILLRMRTVSDQRGRESQNTHFIFSNFFSENCALYRDNVEKCGGAREATNDNTTRRMRVACWISKATRARAHAHARAPSTHTKVNTNTRAPTPPNTHTKKYIIHGNNNFANAPQFYFVRKFTVLLFSAVRVTYLVTCIGYYGVAIRTRNS